MKTRRSFLKSTLITSGLFFTGTSSLFAQQDRPDPIDPAIINEFVRVGHGNIDRVKEMLENQPNLIYGTWDWGGGDYETAIEGAGHVGNKEIANYLISKGARSNLFVMTMLGKSELVTPYLEEYPELIYSKGPHGFSLLHHAQVGESEEMVEYLSSKGLTETKFRI